MHQTDEYMMQHFCSTIILVYPYQTLLHRSARVIHDGGTRNTLGQKIGLFLPASRYITETIQDNAKLLTLVQRSIGSCYIQCLE